MTRRLLPLLALLALALPATASAEGTFVDWTSFLPATATEYEPSSSDECTSGKLACVDKVIREMTKDFDRLAAACDHNAIFSLAYLRTTEEYKRAATEPGFFEDPAFVNHEDAVFASYYFKPLNAYRAGDRSQVPGAWKIAVSSSVVPATPLLKLGSKRRTISWVKATRLRNWLTLSWSGLREVPSGLTRPIASST